MNSGPQAEKASESSGKVALITGITGQDGSYLAEQLLEKGYVVHGIVRRSSSLNRARIDHLRAKVDSADSRLFLHYADLHDATTLRRILVKAGAHEMYHLAGQSHVGLSFDMPESTVMDTAMATLSLLEIIRDLPSPPRFYHAASSEIFGAPTVSPQDESTPFNPTSPYGCAKVLATGMARIYREVYGLFVCNGITYNHESPRRGENFVTRKITRTVARIAAGLEDCLTLGNLDATRDWGYAPDFTRFMWLTLQHPVAGDYIAATGQSHSVREFAGLAFQAAGIAIRYENGGDQEIGIDSGTGQVILRVSSKFFRPAESVRLVGNPEKAASVLGWKPLRTLPEIVAEMVEADSLSLGRQPQARL